MIEIIDTHEKAEEILEIFQEVLRRFEINVPSPTDLRNSSDDAIYGDTYLDLLDDIEIYIFELLRDCLQKYPNIKIDRQFDAYSPQTELSVAEKRAEQTRRDKEAKMAIISKLITARHTRGTGTFQKAIKPENDEKKEGV